MNESMHRTVSLDVILDILYVSFQIPINTKNLLILDFLKLSILQGNVLDRSYFFKIETITEILRIRIYRKRF